MIPRKSMIWKIFAQHLILILLSLLIVSIYATDAIKNIYLQRIQTDLKSRGYLISQLLLPDIIQGRITAMNDEVHRFSKDLDIRITVILPNGRVIADSDEDYLQMENHADRPEIRAAFQKQMGSSIRFSVTLNLDMLYVAVPVFQDNHVIAVLRTAMPFSDLSETLRAINKKIALTGLWVVFIAGLIGFLSTYFINKPIQIIQQGTARIGNGELNHRIYITKPDELKQVAESMNKMADQLEERIQMITKQRNELEAILSSMVEALLVFDNREKIIRVNHAMSQWLNTRPEEVIGKDLQTIIRNINLQRFIRKTLNSERPQELEFNIDHESERTVQVHGTLLQDAGENTIGGLIVLNDISRQKALENIRREFVANVSHELKTPITAIQGFVETLREGAIHDKNKAPEFLDIIMRHTDRLNAIIEDLLNLSRIERDAEKGEIVLESASIRQMLQEAQMICQNKASEKIIELKFEMDIDLHLNINTPLLTQAVVNLIDNAIKYSSEKSQILITAQKVNGEITIQIKDKGMGIPEKDLPRIFERFYRVDKARSRQLGGTGLGLSIVKHIVQAHGGRVTAESKVGVGSVFSIILYDPIKSTK